MRDHAFLARGTFFPSCPPGPESFTPMPTFRLSAILALATVLFVPSANAVAQVVQPLPAGTLLFDSTIQPLGQFNIPSTQSLQITQDHNLARQQVALALAYLSVNRQTILAGNDQVYNTIFGGFYDRSNPNYQNGYVADDSNYQHVIRTFGQIRLQLEQQTTYNSGLTNPATTDGNIAAMDATAFQFQNLDRGMRQWGMSNSDSLAVYDAFFPQQIGNIRNLPAPVDPNLAFPTGPVGNVGVGQQPLVAWDRDTVGASNISAQTLYSITPPTVNDFIQPSLPASFQIKFTQSVTTSASTPPVTTFTASPLSVLEHSNRVYASSVDNAFFHQKLDIFANPDTPNDITLGDVFFKNTKSVTNPGDPIERAGNIADGLLINNPQSQQTAGWNSTKDPKQVPGYTDPGAPQADFNVPGAFKVPDLQRYQMIISSMSEFSTSPLDIRGGAFFGISELVRALDGGNSVSSMIAGAYDAGNFAKFVEALSPGGSLDPRNFPPVGKNGGFQPAIP